MRESWRNRSGSELHYEGSYKGGAFIVVSNICDSRYTQISVVIPAEDGFPSATSVLELLEKVFDISSPGISPLEGDRLVREGRLVVQGVSETRFYDYREAGILVFLSETIDSFSQ